ncbi:MAG: hypothetical protein GY778_06160 [bacterium]|nr:hypothetical protein [bacterium]
MVVETIMRKKVRSLLCLVGAAVALVASVQPAHATDHSWHTAANGYFLWADNWSPASIPNDNDDEAIFGVSGEYIVEFNASYLDPTIVNKSIEVSAGTVKFDLVYEIMMFPDAEVTYRLDPPSTMFTTAARIGTTAGPQAQLIVGGGHDGYSGTVEAEGALIIGLAPGSSGRVDIGDPDSYGIGYADWTSAYPTWVGMNGTGALFVNSGELTDGGAIIGLSAGVQGTATVAGGQWTNHGSLTVGFNGTGTLNVDGSIITDDDVYIGRSAGSEGTATSDWASWTIGGALYVGGDDQGAGGTGDLTVGQGGLGSPHIDVTGDTTIWPTGEVSIEGGTLSVLGQLNAHSGSQLDLSDGALEVGSLTGFDGSLLNWTGGAVNITNGSLSIDVGEPFGINLPVAGSKSLSVSGGLNVGPVSNGILSVTSGGTVTSGSATIGSLAPDMLQASALLNGVDTSWTIAGDLNVRGAVVSHLSVVSGATVSNNNAYLAAEPGTNALVTLYGATDDVLWNCAGDLYAGGDELASQGGSTVQVRGGAQLNVAGTLKVWDDSVLEIDGGAVDTHDLDIAGEVVLLNSGVLDVCGGMLDIDNGGTLNGAITGDSWTEVALHDNYTSWLIPGSLQVAAADPGAGHVGALTVETGTTVTVDENVTVSYGPRLVLAGGTINADLIDMLGTDFTGFGTLNGEFAATGSVTATGTLTVGDINSYNGVQIGGALDVGPHSVTINKNGMYTIGNMTSIAGGTLTAPNGVALPVGSNLVAHGTISARVTTQAGATIEAVGSLSLGDPTSPIGFIAEGDLVVNANTVAIQDANEAALGPMTVLGDAGSPGTLVAANGLVLASADNVLGFGVIDTPDDPTKPLMNAGAIFGNSATEQIELTGYITGLGMLDYVTISGTDDLGSVGPAAVTRGSVDYAGKIVVEIGGLFAGTEHDQTNHSATAGLGGELMVELIGGFEPGPGDSFTIITYASQTGQFDTLTLPTLAAGLQWDVDYGPSSLTLMVAEDLPGDCNLDGAVDLGDHADFDACLLGPGGGLGTGCECFDFDADGDVTLFDFAEFQVAFTGP